MQTKLQHKMLHPLLYYMLVLWLQLNCRKELFKRFCDYKTKPNVTNISSRSTSTHKKKYKLYDDILSVLICSKKNMFFMHKNKKLKRKNQTEIKMKHILDIIIF